MQTSSILETLSGIYAPIVTPFTERQDLDLDALRHNLRRYHGTEIRGFLVLGSNGENKSLSEEEKRQVLEVVKENKGDKAVMVGVMYESQKMAQQFMLDITHPDCDYALVQNPHYFKKRMTDDILYGYFVDVANASPVPIILYNAPGFTGLELSFQLIQRLSDHPNIIGIKDSSPHIFENLALSSDHFRMMAGSISTLFPALLKGAVGGTVSLANYLPDLAVRLWEYGNEKDEVKGAVLHEKLQAVNGRIAGEYGVAGVKAAMTLSGFRGGIPRKPLLPLAQQALTDITTQLECLT